MYKQQLATCTQQTPNEVDTTSTINSINTQGQVLEKESKKVQLSQRQEMEIQWRVISQNK